MTWNDDTDVLEDEREAPPPIRRRPAAMTGEELPPITLPSRSFSPERPPDLAAGRAPAAPPPIRPRGGAMTGDSSPVMPPIRNIAPPIAPEVSAPAPSSTPMPISHAAPQPTLSQAILGSLGAMPHAAEDRYNAMNAQGPPILHGWKGALDAIAQGTRARGIEAAIPGTPGNFNRNLTQAEGNANTEAGLNASNLRQQLEPETAQEESELRGAQTNEANARAAKESQPTPEGEEKIGQTVETGEGVMQWNPDTKRYDIKVGPNKPSAAAQRPDTIEMGNDTYQWNGKGWDKIGPAKKSPATEGTWTLEEDEGGKPILYNSKTAETRPANGIQKSGTKAKADAATEKTTAPVEAAMQYADDYLTNGSFTGSGDEALQEKFFELAKPSVGFRMTAPQMDMLRNSRSWMGSIEAHMRHATTGTWFSDEQRKQIVQTMKQLGEAKKKALASDGQSQNAESKGGKLTVDEARDYLQKAGGDKVKAREMAKADGRSF